MNSQKIMGLLAIPRETLRVSAGWISRLTIGLPQSVVSSVRHSSKLDVWDDERVFKIIGDALLSTVDAWGPMYGKAFQIVLSRLNPRLHSIAESFGLDRIYSDWPPVPWTDVQLILDQEIPAWRDTLEVESVPLGVASLSQVHAAKDHGGRDLVVKFLKPHSAKRLRESIEALRASLDLVRPLAVSKAASRFVVEMGQLCDGLEGEMDLTRELQNMQRVRDLLGSRHSNAIVVPETVGQLSTARVIVMQRLNGVKLSDVVSGKTQVSDQVRQALAKKVLSELLVQIFEWGLFHADPHGGNLMLLEDGRVGLYDWGLAGELSESDRKFIASTLRAVISMNMERLIDVLQELAKATTGADIDRLTIRTELKDLQQLIETQSAGGDVSGLNAMINHALEAADRLGIKMPEGLLMMAKSLVTIEGLARGLDRNVAFGRVAAPVLLKAARPGFQEMVDLVKQVPKITRRWLNKL
jgi:ubiquinone biosynthesis protein